MKRIARRIFLSLFCSLFLLTLFACAGATPPKNEEEPPKRVAVLFSSYAKMWRDAGGDIAITVGEAIERGFADADTPIVDAGAGKSIHVELLLSYAPDLVILSSDVPAQLDAERVLKQAGIRTLALRVETFEDYLDAFYQMTAITKNEEAYRQKGESVRLEIEEIFSDPAIDAIAGTSILFVRAGTTDSSVKPKGARDHFAAQMLEELGCVNLADAGAFSAGLNMESLLSEDPEYLFFSIMGEEEGVLANIAELLSRPAFKALTAVKEGRVIILPKELFHFKPCDRWAEAYRYLIEELIGETK